MARKNKRDEPADVEVETVDEPAYTTNANVVEDDQANVDAVDSYFGATDTDQENVDAVDSYFGATDTDLTDGGLSAEERQAAEEAHSATVEQSVADSEAVEGEAATTEEVEDAVDVSSDGVVLDRPERLTSASGSGENLNQAAVFSSAQGGE